MAVRKRIDNTRAERQERLRQNREAQGLVRFELWVTPEERMQVRAFLTELRKEASN